ncbi:endonuclease III [Mucilaginibacter arboris]|uniref:Endonuclease III n=1 Tax=Mucilaginibacter arboris TaxID=2682090 RepID=A0A7K1SZ54_9SPHI|nr:endonuclease III [Mucilaginibacter arboris]MVN22592.1 endonuclease III [Mucilaginibacter arboris]
MLKTDRYKAFVAYFSAHQPNPVTELHYNSPYELLVAVILSAQCTDKRINQVTPALFARFPTPESLAAATVEEVYTYIKSVSYPNNKAKHLVGMAKILVAEFNGIVPQGIDDLQKMPGVGRKTANVISSVVYQEPAIAVDTHVFRVSNRLGLTFNAKTPLATEMQLMKYLPKELLGVAHHWLILHGRYICVARNPKCEICPLTHFCKYFQQMNTETALKKKELQQMQKAKLIQKNRKLNPIAARLKKYTIPNTVDSID